VQRQEVASHDVSAVLREHGPYAWRVLRRLGVREADVEDVCQEVFLVIHRRLSDFEGRSSMRTWVYGICVRVASDYRKRAVNRREVLTEEMPDQIAADDPHGALATRRAREMLDHILSQLDDDKRAVFVLYEIEGLGMSEVADALGCPLQTAYSRLHAARAFVQKAARAATDEGSKPS
jgi:RNA polymerase sigma-70 factor (ECF subfamily)